MAAVWPVATLRKDHDTQSEARVPDYDFRTPRLFVDSALGSDQTLTLDRDQSHYLLHVLRRKMNDPVLVFNGRDGEWLGHISDSGKKSAWLTLSYQTRAQPAKGGIDLLFAPIKHARLDYLVQKAVEMGASRIRPVMTDYTQVTRLNPERLYANMVEAAEQCGILAVPELLPEQKLDVTLAALDHDHTLIFCDERAEVTSPLASLQKPIKGPLAVLIGPEGGFSPEEREKINKIQSVIRLSLGPRILRADTAAVVALALVQSTLGDIR